MITEHAANVAWLEEECKRICAENAEASERVIQGAILFSVGSRFRAWRQNAGKFRMVAEPCARCAERARWVEGAPTGAADLSGILPGGVRLEIEVKSANGRQTPEQRNWQRMVQTQGGVYILAQP